MGMSMYYRGGYVEDETESQGTGWSKGHVLKAEGLARLERLNRLGEGA